LGREMKRGEVWWARLDKRRPVVLVSRDEACDVRALVIAAPATTTVRSYGRSRRWPDHRAQAPRRAHGQTTQTLSAIPLSRRARPLPRPDSLRRRAHAGKMGSH
jgi:mRNA-degrading endonuclease toxin of MazEF toxin-antitoxin module